MPYKTAKRFVKAVRGKVDFLSIENYLDTLNIKIILFNTPQGDTEVMRYGLQEKILKTSAFTYCSTVKIVFIDNNVSYGDKLYYLLHEVGHILLGHIGDGKAYARNKVFIEIEADVFAYEVLRLRKNNYCAPPKISRMFKTIFGKKGSTVR